MKKQTTIIVTGCAGFIGSNFVAAYRRRYPGHRIIGIDDLSTGRKDAVHPHIVFYQASITDQPAIERIFKKHKPRYVFHFAALPRVSYSVEHPIESGAVNIIGTLTLLDAAARHGVRRFIYSASSAAYGDAKHLPTTERDNPPHPRSPYAVQKYTGEIFCRVWSELYGLDTVSLRYFNVYGPGQYGDSPYSTVISLWLEALYFPKTKRAFIEGTGSQSRDFCYIENVIAANLRAMQAKKPLRGAAINIAHGERHTINDVRRLIEQYTGKKLDLERRPPRKGDVAHTHADIKAAKKLIGYAPKVNFEKGLKKTVAWFEARLNANAKKK